MLSGQRFVSCDEVLVLTGLLGQSDDGQMLALVASLKLMCMFLCMLSCAAAGLRPSASGLQRF